MSRTFRIKADFTFEAEGIDDAFERLSEHFRSLNQDEDPVSIITNGECVVEPAQPAAPTTS